MSISLASYEAPSLAEIESAVTVPDEMVSRILDVACFHHWKYFSNRECEAWYQLKKPLPGLPVGMLIRRDDLIARLS